MAKWINRSTTEIETFGTGKKEISAMSPIRIYGFLQKRKMCCLFPIFVAQDIPRRGKY